MNTLKIATILFFIKNKTVRISLYLFFSIVIGFLLGWYYKLPNVYFLTKLIPFETQLARESTIESVRQVVPLISNEYFSFNWFMFFFSSIICFFILIITDYLKYWLDKKLENPRNS